jgi:ATP-dependent helicase/nuclease subunit A
LFTGPECLPNGQVVKGQVDLLLDAPAGWILIDHKANPRGGDAWEEVARRYSGQLKLYKMRICAATSRPVAEVWLYFPVAAGAISVRV